MISGISYQSCEKVDQGNKALGLRSLKREATQLRNNISENHDISQESRNVGGQLCSGYWLLPCPSSPC